MIITKSQKEKANQLLNNARLELSRVAAIPIPICLEARIEINKSLEAISMAQRAIKAQPVEEDRNETR